VPPAVAGLRERLAHDVERDALDLDVHLERSRKGKGRERGEVVSERWRRGMDVERAWAGMGRNGRHIHIHPLTSLYPLGTQ
jgi:hypothetical protein